MLIGTTYWPLRKGTLLWSEFDHGEVREELRQLASIGLDTIRLPLHWEDFQPRLERVDVRVLRALERTLNLAGDARLKVVPALLPLAIAGAIHVPEWATASSFAADMELSTRFGPLLIVRNQSSPPLVWERTSHASEVRDLWTNPAMRDAQRSLIGEVVGNFADHEAISGWELGSGLELARAPSSNDAAATWLGETAESLREHGARGRLMYGLNLRALVRGEGPRPEAIVEAACTPVVNLVPPEPTFAGVALAPDAARFVAALLRSLCGELPIVTIGAAALPGAAGRSIVDRAYGVQVQQPLLDPDAYADLAATSIADLRAAGAPGLMFAHAYCYGQPFVPTDAHSRREALMGLFDPQGQELPIANAVAQAAGVEPPAQTVELPALDVDDYWDDAAASFRRLWEAWNLPEDS